MKSTANTAEETLNSSSLSTENAFPMTTELQSRARDINSGDLSTVVFMQTRISRRQRGKSVLDGVGDSTVQVSGHIDLGHRQTTENYVPYLTGEKRLAPKSGDLTFYNKFRADSQSSRFFEVKIVGSRLLLRHRVSGIELDASNIKEGQDEKTLNEHKSSGWKRIQFEDEHQTYVYLCDIRKVK